MLQQNETWRDERGRAVTKREVLYREERCECLCCNGLGGVVMKGEVLQQNERRCSRRRGVINSKKMRFCSKGR